VAAEALRVVERLVGVMRPSPPAPIEDVLAPHLRPLFDAVMKRFQAQDQDQEVGACRGACRGLCRGRAALGPAALVRAWAGPGGGRLVPGLLSSRRPG
jgi:hypothetical protein